MTETEVTVAELVAREGRTWPAVDGAPRHLLDEPEPEVQPGALVALWFGAPPPRVEARPDDTRDDVEGGAALVRPYTQTRRSEGHPS